MAKRWGEDETTFLAENAEKLGVKECARRLGRSENSTLQKAIYNGFIIRKPVKSESVEALRKDIMRNYNIHNINEFTRKSGHERSYIVSIFKNAFDALSKSTLQAIRSSFKQGYTREELSEQYELSLYAIERILFGKKVALNKFKKPKIIKSKYRTDELSGTVRFQICVDDFEGYDVNHISKLWCLNPLCLPRMIQSMKDSGEYDICLKIFKHNNFATYKKVLDKQRKAV